MLTKKKKLRTIIIPTYIIVVCTLLFCFKFGYVVSGSMIPTINIGESVIYSPALGYNTINKGDIIIYHNSSLNLDVIHRVIDEKYEYINDKLTKVYKVKGDNNVYPDQEYVTPNNYIGKVLYISEIEWLNKLLGAAHSSKVVRLFATLMLPGIASLLLLFIMLLLSDKENKNSLSAGEGEKTMDELNETVEISAATDETENEQSDETVEQHKETDTEDVIEEEQPGETVTVDTTKDEQSEETEERLEVEEQSEETVAVDTAEERPKDFYIEKFFDEQNNIIKEQDSLDVIHENTVKLQPEIEDTTVPNCEDVPESDETLNEAEDTVPNSEEQSYTAQPTVDDIAALSAVLFETDGRELYAEDTTELDNTETADIDTSIVLPEVGDAVYMITPSGYERLIVVNIEPCLDNSTEDNLKFKCRKQGTIGEWHWFSCDFNKQVFLDEEQAIEIAALNKQTAEENNNSLPVCEEQEENNDSLPVYEKQEEENNDSLPVNEEQKEEKVERTTQNTRRKKVVRKAVKRVSKKSKLNSAYVISAAATVTAVSTLLIFLNKKGE